MTTATDSIIGWDEAPAQRLRRALSMQRLGRQLQRQRLLRQAREAGQPTDDAAIDAMLYAWLLHRPSERSDARRLACLLAEVGA
ncbi:MAG: hypothetical protein H6747_05075 [Deltaproteobacteria bacterium]|nr:hypothetical protein [Deltaproteobacteria bacterium]